MSSKSIGAKALPEHFASFRLGMSYARLFLVGAGIILLITGSAKLISAFGHAPVLNTADPVFKISFRNLFFVAGFLEMIVSSACLFDKKPLLNLKLVAWLATTFVAYRLALAWVGWTRPCSCLGNLTDALHVPPKAADWVAQIFLVYLFLGSMILLLHHRKALRRSEQL